MPFHFCMDEVYMILAMLPFIGAFFRKLHAKYHAKHNHHFHNHEEVHEELFDVDIILSEDSEESIDLDSIQLDNVIERFGYFLVDGLRAKYNFWHLQEQSFTWFVLSADHKYLEVHCEGRVFIYRYYTNSWEELLEVKDV